VSFEAFRTSPSEGARPTVLTFVPDGSGGVSGVRVLNILFGRARAAVNCHSERSEESRSSR
jgi:hypothetical protein